MKGFASLSMSPLASFSMSLMVAALSACADPSERAASSPTSPAAVPGLTPAAAAPVVAITATPRAALPRLGPSLFGLDLDLEDQHGRRVDTASLQAKGGTLIVSMFYATCTYACPTLIRDVVAIDQRLSPEARKNTRVLLVTFDPEHDTPEVFARLATAHAVPTDRWTFARARSEEATRELAAALGITYRRLPDGNYNHSSILAALDEEGVPRANIDGLKQDATRFIGALEGLAGPRP